MGVAGDFAALARFRSNLQQVAKGGFTPELSLRLGETSTKLVQDGFRLQRNPYGVPWEPLAHKRARGSLARAKVLQDTGRMRASVNFAAEAKSFRMMIPVAYAPVHQYGATIPARSNAHAQVLNFRRNKSGRAVFSKPGRAQFSQRAKRATFGAIKIPQRQMLPMASTGGLGPIWLRAYNQTATDLLKRRLQVAA